MYHFTINMNTSTKKTCGNSRFAKAGVSYFYDNEVLNSSFVHLMKFSAKKPRLRKAANRCRQYADKNETLNNNLDNYHNDNSNGFRSG
jgi:hypothetical protein